MSLSPARDVRLAALRAEVQAIEHAGRRGDAGALPFGINEIDGRLAEGGLALAALHEAAGASSGLWDDAAATLFVTGIAARLPGTVLWTLTRRDLFAPGLACAGLNADRVLYAEARSDEEVLAVMEEGLRHGGLAAVVGEVAKASMAATRRLQLAAEEGGTMALLHRRHKKSGSDPLAETSAAMTRWRLACAPSAPLPVEGVGRACWRVTLARQRGGDGHEWILEECDATGRLALPAPARDRPAAGNRGARRQAA
ncbi:ImuA family protein [Sphingomonas sp. ID0503]|uniref:ImuA family protein n=1 Tax=Sphingomonas sp. ID0503 TaxID=3399691 RepID=UPI003AFAC7DC